MLLFITYISLIEAFPASLFLFMAIELSIAAFLRSLPPDNLCLAQTPTRECVLPTMCVVGVA